MVFFFVCLFHFFEEYRECKVLATFHFEDFTRKQSHWVISDPLVHLRVKADDRL